MPNYPVHTIASVPEGSKSALEQLKKAFGVLPNLPGGEVMDAKLQELLKRLREYPGVAQLKPPLSPQGPVLPIVFRKGKQRFSCFSLITTVGTPQCITAQELRVECMFPTNVEEGSGS